mmetsp:Transcript_69719/g.225438  ORF Transcript_69719/g.225438 Transcript_69719/m.225438 type:complete len:231 (+) Transcript_69719:614-1306(+)
MARRGLCDRRLCTPAGRCRPLPAGCFGHLQLPGVFQSDLRQQYAAGGGRPLFGLHGSLVVRPLWCDACCGSGGGRLPLAAGQSSLAPGRVHRRQLLGLQLPHQIRALARQPRGRQRGHTDRHTSEPRPGRRRRPRPRRRVAGSRCSHDAAELHALPSQRPGPGALRSQPGTAAGRWQVLRQGRSLSGDCCCLRVKQAPVGSAGSSRSGSQPHGSDSGSDIVEGDVAVTRS